MQRLFRGISLLEPVINCRTFTLTSVTRSWNYVAYTRSADLGRQIYEAFAVKNLIDQFPDWSALQINDVTQGLADNDKIHEKVSSALDILKSTSNSSDVFSKLGGASLKDDDDLVSELLDTIRAHCFSNISFNDAESLVKQQHPKHLLKSICEKENQRVFLDTVKLEGDYVATVFCEDDEVCKVSHNELKEAERRACLQTLQLRFREQYETYDIDYHDLPLEEHVNLGSDAYMQRVVNMRKSAEESFGFTIRGGEQKVIRNKDYIQLHIITPVFISSVEEMSPASKCCLKVGDVLLAVNDHSLIDCTHGQAVHSLKKFTDREDIEFTVKHVEKEVYKYEAERKFLEREKEKIREEIDSEKMGKWHVARAKTDPEEYYLETFKHKKRPYQHKKARKSIRLWDYKP